MKTTCAYCGKNLDRPKCRIKRYNYCNASCQNRFLCENKEYRERIIKKAQEKIKQNALKRFLEDPLISIGERGYYEIYIPKLADYPFKKGRRYFHHYVWEKANNKPIKKGFCIHHKDGNPLNNELDNLELMRIEEHDKLYKKIPRGKAHWNYKEGSPRKGTEFICRGCGKKGIRTRFNQNCCNFSCASKIRWNKPNAKERAREILNKMNRDKQGKFNKMLSQKT